MNYDSIGIPLLALLVGFISLLIDHHEKNRRFLVGLLVVSLIATCGLGISSNISSSKEEEEQRNKIESLSRDNSNLIATLSEFKNNTESDLDDILSKLDSWFIEPNGISVSQVKESVRANEKLEKLALALPNNTNTKIKYYVKDIDNQTVIDTLTSKGMSVEKGMANLKNDKTNAIWYGKNVGLDEVKYVALSLVRAGIEIRTIKPYSDINRKKNILEIGSDRERKNRPVYSVSKIENATKFTRQD